MKFLRCILITVLLLFAFEANAGWVRPYTRSDGTFVSGHYRNRPSAPTYVRPYFRKDGTFVRGHMRYPYNRHTNSRSISSYNSPSSNLYIRSTRQVTKSQYSRQYTRSQYQSSYIESTPTPTYDANDYSYNNGEAEAIAAAAVAVIGLGVLIASSIENNNRVVREQYAQHLSSFENNVMDKMIN